MKTFTHMAAQGDFVILRVNELPEELKPITPTDGSIVVAHSETGHNHVMLADKVEAYCYPELSDSELYEMFLLVKQPTEITHLREHDTHETLLVPKGMYKIRRQREYTPEGWRRAQD